MHVPTVLVGMSWTVWVDADDAADLRAPIEEIAAQFERRWLDESIPASLG